jgi:hypothetical protein
MLFKFVIFKCSFLYIIRGENTIMIEKYSNMRHVSSNDSTQNSQ